eukprot:c36910_g1_i1.p1 GENE.c36910_g1_i1~~c36910_g1_i1.p1  ORF type:complete len:249 (-),score=77.41 c36910_g1_i1:13-759(-)
METDENSALIDNEDNHYSLNRSTTTSKDSSTIEILRPPSLVGLFLLTPILSFLISFLRGTANISLPTISQCCRSSPESVLKGFGFVLLGCCFVRFGRLVFNFLSGALHEPPHHLAFISLSFSFLCSFSVFGLAFASLSPLETEETFDDLSSILVLSLSILCLTIHFGIRKSEGQLTFASSCVLGLGVLCAILYVALKPFHLERIRALSEWSCTCLISAYLFMVSSEIKDDVVRSRPRLSQTGTLKGDV